MNLVFDLGGMSTKIAIFDNQEIKLKSTINYDGGIEAKKLLSRIDDEIKIFLNSYKIDNICFSSPGVIDFATGKNTGLSAIENLNDVNFKTYFEKKYQISTWVENDANCAAIAEIKLNEKCKNKNSLFIVIGTGIGGGVAINGELFKGTNLFAGEIGYSGFGQTIDDLKSLSFKTGLHGVVNNFNNKNKTNLNGKEIFDLYTSDEYAKELFDNMIFHLALFIMNSICLIDFDCVLIGGAISINDNFIKMLYSKIKEISQKLSIPSKFLLEKCQFQNDSNLIGANLLPKIT